MNEQPEYMTINIFGFEVKILIKARRHQSSEIPVHMHIGNVIAHAKIVYSTYSQEQL